jgi:hypothetical protein
MINQLAVDLERIRRSYGTTLGGREREFLVYGGTANGSYHILACDDGGGFAIADGIDSHETAELISRPFESGSAAAPRFARQLFNDDHSPGGA